MSRPGRSNSHAYHLRRSHLRQAFTSRAPASPSLLSNIRALENNMVSTRAAELLRSPTLVRDLHRELSSILGELRFITQRVGQDVAYAEEASDWKFAAMVVDRFCFLVCAFYFVLCTLAIFLSVLKTKPAG